MPTGWRRWPSYAVAGAALLVPLPARADVGIPVGAVFWPATWLLFLPVILVEAGVARRVLRLRFADGLRLSLKANAWSTVAGVPLACLLTFVTGLTLGPGLSGAWPWLGELMFSSAVWLDGLPDWVVFSGPALICIPCYFLSVRIEAWSAAKKIPYADALRWAKIANRLTYGVLFGILVVAAAFTPGRRHY